VRMPIACTQRLSFKLRHLPRLRSCHAPSEAIRVGLSEIDSLSVSFRTTAALLAFFIAPISSVAPSFQPVVLK
jgi:hypothetical protein